MNYLMKSLSSPLRSELFFRQQITIPMNLRAQLPFFRRRHIFLQATASWFQFIVVGMLLADCNSKDFQIQKFMSRAIFNLMSFNVTSIVSP